MKKFPPYPSKAHPSGQARIKIAGRQVYLGKFGSSESHTEYARLKAAWEVGDIPDVVRPKASAPSASASASLTVADAVALFFEQCRSHHIREEDGTPKKEMSLYVDAVKPLAKLYGKTPLADFRVSALKAVRQAMVDHGWTPRVVNHHVVRVRHVFRWLEEQELAPEGRWNHLRALKGLRAGVADVPPVPEADLAATLPELRPVVRGLVEVLLWTGARPSEIMTLQRGDVVQAGRIELSPGVWLMLGKVWAAVLAHHKTAYAGHRRIIFFGPKAQAALTPFLERTAEAYLFSPRESVAKAQLKRKRRKVGERYTPCSLLHAIHAACERAGVDKWGPYRLRHNAASRLANELGPDVARVVLGHRDLAITRRYVLDDVQKAVDAMEKAG